MSAEALAYDLITLPDLRLDNNPLIVAADLLSRLPMASRQATAQEVEAYAQLRAGATRQTQEDGR